MIIFSKIKDINELGLNTDLASLLQQYFFINEDRAQHNE